MMGKTASGLAALIFWLPTAALAQFAVDAEPQALRQALKRTTLSDLTEGESALVAGPLRACVRDRALFVPTYLPTAEQAAEGENYRVRRLAENAVEVETVTTDERLHPRLKIALGLALTGIETDCARLFLPEDRLFRVATIDGETNATALLKRLGVLEEAQEAAPPPPAEPTPATEPPRGWRFSEEVAEGGVHAALVATLDPRTAEDPAAPRLRMRCENGVVSLSIGSDAITWESRTEVTLRIGEGKVTAHRWRPGTDGKAVGLWTSAEAVPFIRKLPDDTGLFVRLRDRNPLYVEFDLGNLSQSADRITKACE